MPIEADTPLSGSISVDQWTPTTTGTVAAWTPAKAQADAAAHIARLKSIIAEKVAEREAINDAIRTARADLEAAERVVRALNPRPTKAKIGADK